MNKTPFLSWCDRNLMYLISLLLIVLTIGAYWGIQHNEFINYDDGVYITENHYVQAGLTLKGVIWAFTTTRAGNWHPLTWLSHMLDCQLYGLNPGHHHSTSLVFHIANTLMLFLLFKRMTGTLWVSSFVAAMFALHPLHVESVAWGAERKDVLSTFLLILTVWAYVGYAKRPSLNRYLLVLLSFVLGLMAKPMLVTLPVVLLLLDYWPLCRLELGGSGCEGNPQMIQTVNSGSRSSIVSRLIVEKAPLFALAAASSLLTFFVQQNEGAVTSFELLPVEVRMANALISYVGYIGKMISPHPLAVFYPYPNLFPLWKVVGAALFLICVSILVIHSRKRYSYLMVGWLWYLVTLMPVIGLVQVGEQAMADRYTYVPLVGLFVMLGMGIPKILGGWKNRKAILAILAAILFSSYFLLTRNQVRYWYNSITLFTHTLNVTANNYRAYNLLGLALFSQGRLQEAISLISMAQRLRPNHPDVYNNLGIVLAQQGKIKEAMTYFSKALQIKADHAEVHSNIGNVLVQQGKIQEAIEHYTQAVRIKPDFPTAHFSLGLAFLSIGDSNSALCESRILMAIDPYLANKLSQKILKKE
jgi:hypothetical protein